MATSGSIRMRKVRRMALDGMTLPPDDRPTLREQLEESGAADPRDQHSSMGPNGMMYTPASINGRFRLWHCELCDEDYISKAYLEAHECPGRPGETNKEE
jgi:hypothetical protein